MDKTADISQESLFPNNSVISLYIKSQLILSILLSAFLAMSCGYIEDDEELMKAAKTMIRTSPGYSIRTLDTFTFNYDGLMTMDSYQRFEDTGDLSRIRIASQGGWKKIFACANSQIDKNGWANVNSYEALAKMHADLGKETMSDPVMTGECSLNATVSEDSAMDMKLIGAEVILNSVCCDFSGKGYEGEEITDVRIYLINVNATCSLVPGRTVMPERILNMGRLNENDMGTMSEPDLITYPFSHCITKLTEDLRIRFRCYPNTSPDESPGSPFTRLVIEGKIRGKTYFWPVNIGRENGGCGVERNCRYVYNIRITGKGSDSPDILPEEGSMETETEVSQWKEKDDCIISF